MLLVDLGFYVKTSSDLSYKKCCREQWNLWSYKLGKFYTTVLQVLQVESKLLTLHIHSSSDSKWLAAYTSTTTPDCSCSVSIFLLSKYLPICKTLALSLSGNEGGDTGVKSGDREPPDSWRFRWGDGSGSTSFLSGIVRLSRGRTTTWFIRTGWLNYLYDDPPNTVWSSLSQNLIYVFAVLYTRRPAVFKLTQTVTADGGNESEWLQTNVRMTIYHRLVIEVISAEIRCCC